MKKQTTIFKDVGTFIWTFFTRWQSYAADAPTWLAIDFWERRTGKSMDNTVYFSFMIVVFAVVSFFVMWRKQKYFIDDTYTKFQVLRMFDLLLMKGYEVKSSGMDSWCNECVQFLEKLFGKDGYETKVFKKEVKDESVNMRFAEQKGKIQTLKGGRMPHPNSLFYDEEGSIIFQMVALRWAAGRFEEKYPLTNM